jgi:hypothetical protein
MTENVKIDSYDDAKSVVERAKEGDLVIGLNRIGAAPTLSYEPYTNNRGVKINHWMCVSYQFETRPERTLLNIPTIVKPWEHDSWEVNLLSGPWVISQVKQSRAVELKPKSETIFARLGGYEDD